MKLANVVLMEIVISTMLIASTATVTASQQDTVDVSIVNFDFVPDNLTVEAGTTVRWTNDGSITHTTTSLANPRIWDSGNMAPGEVFTHTFTSEEMGTQDYFCELHPVRMQATLEVTFSTDVEDQNGPSQPDGFEVGPNYPNPFNPSTTIQYSLEEPEHVTIEIFNALGQRVAVLVDGPRPVGNHSVKWNGTNPSGATVAAGTYLYRVTAGEQSQTRTMMLVK